MDAEHDNGFRRDGGVRENLSRAPVALVQDQAAKFDLARTLSDRSRRGLPCDRSRRSGVNQTKPPETTLASDAESPLRAAFDVRPRAVKASRVAVPPQAQTGDAVLARPRKDLRGRHPGDTLFFGLTILFALLVIVVAAVMVGILVV